MNIAEISSSELGSWIYALGAVIQIAASLTILATINSKQRREISFAGEPLDRKEFDRMVAENSAMHDQLFAKIGVVERSLDVRLAARIDKFEAESRESRQLLQQNICAIGNDVAALKKEAELANQRAFQMDSKIDHLIERER
jgi:hypothetical protein